MMADHCVHLTIQLRHMSYPDQPGYLVGPACQLTPGPGPVPPEPGPCPVRHLMCQCLPALKLVVPNPARNHGLM